jgi:hypothetical protein
VGELLKRKAEEGVSTGYGLAGSHLSSLSGECGADEDA